MSQQGLGSPLYDVVAKAKELGRPLRPAEVLVIRSRSQQHREEAAAARRAEESAALAKGVDLASLRRHAIVRFDPNEHKLQEAVIRRLGLLPKDAKEDLCIRDGEVLLGGLCRPQGGREYREEGGSGGRGAGTEWFRRWAARSMEEREEFRSAYISLLRKIILPHIKDPRGICFQKDPTFRCHVAGADEPLGRPHCDAEYAHQRAELNFWLPLCSVWGSNSLYCESKPGVADYTSFELGYGEVQRFWGNQLHHYTQSNETTQTRVSFDFRVVPRSCFVEQYEGGMRADGTLIFAIGGFYGWMDSEGEMVA